jgi:hypothetical protein
MTSQAVYYPGTPRQASGPLSRFLPPLPKRAATQWLRATLLQNDQITSPARILDPFGISPDLILELAQGGFTILATANNPILQFFLEFTANLPDEGELRASLAEFAAIKKGNERLEPHIRNLYLTACDQCGNEIEAEAFLWEHRKVGKSDQEVIEPFARIYHCPYCGNAGEFPVIKADLERAGQFPQRGMHYARALERVTSLDDPDRPYVEEALEVYLPRAVYALFTLLNKLDGLDVPHQRRWNLQALMLSAFDEANSLWHYPSPRPRPLQLKIPSRFRENNVWIALEKSVQQWTQGYRELTPVRLTEWPQTPPDGGICLYAGRMSNYLKRVKGEVGFEAIVTALPRPNQAFWTLSALWAGWLWGPEAVAPFKSVLRRRRYDWYWHSSALTLGFDQIKSIALHDIPIFATTGEAETGLISSTLIGANYAGLELQAIAMRTSQACAQFTMQSPQSPIESRTVEKGRGTSDAAEYGLKIRQNSLEAVRDFLIQCGEPKSYLHIHTAALQRVTQDLRLSGVYDTPSEALNHINAIFEGLFSNDRIFRRYGGSEKSLEVGLWWLRDFDGRLSSIDEEIIAPLADRVEKTLVKTLTHNPGISLEELDQKVCRSFPGLLTPETDLITICLESYGHRPDPQAGLWRLRPEDQPDSRARDVLAMRSGLKSLGERFDFSVQGENPILWYEPGGRVRSVFYITDSAAFSDILFSSPQRSERSFIVLPGGRANLVMFKQRQNPILKDQIDQGWRFIKYRQLRWLVENPVLNLNMLMEKLTQDALTFESPQIQLF